MTQENNNHPNDNNNNNNNSNEKKRIVIASSQEIADMMTGGRNNKLLIEPGSHNLLIYHDLKAFREIYSQYSSSLLPQNEVIVISTQYEPLEEVKNTLRLAGIDVKSHLNQGTLFILDAQQGHQGAEPKWIWKFGMSLLFRAKKEGRHGVTWFGDPGSFFSFGKTEELTQYELWLPQKYQEDKMKTVCCYHLADFKNLSESQQQTLFDHHFKSILVR